MKFTHHVAMKKPDPDLTRFHLRGILTGDGGTAALSWFFLKHGSDGDLEGRRDVKQEDVMRAMTDGLVGATRRGRPRQCEAVPAVYPQPRTRAGTMPRPYAGLVLCGLLACGPGSVTPPDDDADIGDDDAVGDDTGDDDTTVGRGTVIVTLRSLAIEPDADAITAEIVLDEIPIGTLAPATVEVPAGSHAITVLRDGFVSPTEQVTVAVDAQTDVECVLGRDLTGTWRLVEENGAPPLLDTEYDVTMFFGATISPTLSACPTLIWVNILGFCLLENDRIWNEKSEDELITNGTIFAEDGRIEAESISTIVDPPWVRQDTWERIAP